MVDGIASAPWSAVLAVQRAAHASGRALAAKLAEHDLTASEINALANLSDDRTCTVSQLAAAAGVRATTMTSVLDRLYARGLIVRTSVPGDRRAVQIGLTVSGRAAAVAIADATADLERSALAALPPSMLAGLRTGLIALAEAAQ